MIPLLNLVEHLFIGTTYSMKVTILKCIMFLRTPTIRYFRLRALKLPGSCVSQRILQGFMLCYGFLGNKLGLRVPGQSRMDAYGGYYD